MKHTNRITSEQIVSAMKVFGGVIHQLAPEVELQRSSVGFHPSQTIYEEVAGIRNVKVELMEVEETGSSESGQSGASPKG